MAEADEQATVYGVSGPIPVTGYLGSAGWTGYGMISGRWYSGPGQVDVPAYFLAVTGKAIGDTVTMTFAGRQIPVRIVGEIFDNQNNGLAMVTDWQTLASADPGLEAGGYDVGLRPGTSPADYARQVQAALGRGYVAGVNSNNKGLPLVLGLIGSLALLLAGAAGLGVLAAVVLQTRERAYQMGVFRAVGMTPRQTIAMVVCSVAGIGLVAGVAAIPAGIALLRSLVPVMGAAAGTGMPPSYLDVYGAAELAGLALAGVVIAVAGALLPASLGRQEHHLVGAARRVRHGSLAPRLSADKSGAVATGGPGWGRRRGGRTSGSCRSRSSGARSRTSRRAAP